MIIYEGPSEIDGKPIVGIMTFVTTNTKLVGDEGRSPAMQLWVIRSDMHPADALATGEDHSICGDCALKGTSGKQRVCYVNPNPVFTIYKRYREGGYTRGEPGAAIAAARRGTKLLRLGAYGDPAALPAWLIMQFCRLAELFQIRYVGYTHQWRTCDQRLKEHLMASCDSLTDFTAAKGLGWRAFTAGLAPEAPHFGIVCPATQGKTVCARCALCDGKRHEDDRRKDIYIQVHGAFPAAKHRYFAQIEG